MKLRALGSVVLGSCMIAACSGGTETGDGSAAQQGEDIVGPSIPDGPKQVVMIYAQVVQSNGSIGTRVCSGSYFAPRVVVTAAHCLANVLGNELFVYYGKNFDADLGQLTPGPNGLQPPPPGQPSLFAQADSFESHPSYDPAQNYPDIGVVYLDRKLPFEPLPLSRKQLPPNRLVAISGWGANSAPTPTTGAGSRVERTGFTRTLGSPTAADFHPEDPNPNLLVPQDRSNQIKLDGHAPFSNSCFGDSGGPILIEEHGETSIAGVGYFVGLSCLDYSLFVRINSFLPFLDEAREKAGHEPLKPVLECVAPNAQGTLTAFFGYDNQNGVSLNVPYGAKNSFAADTTNQRPSAFLPGQHDYTFPVDFSADQTLSWRLSPDSGPTTTLTVNASSPRCGAAQATQSECALSCRASQASGCPVLPSFEQCVQFCEQNTQFVNDVFPDCLAQNSAVNVCTAAVGSDPSNWDCFDGFGAFADVPCAAENDALSTCFSQ